MILDWLGVSMTTDEDTAEYPTATGAVMWAGTAYGQLETDRQRRDALLWNFTVLGEAADSPDEHLQIGI